MPTLTHPTQAALALPYGPIAVGWPVIANETEGPCTQLVAIVGRFDPDTGRPTLHYLATYPHIKRFQGEVLRITPLGAFGVGIEINEAAGTFRCVPLEGVERIAKYRDGRPRKWQPFGAPDQKFRPEVLKMLDRRFLL
jgi:hypothetical protein